MREVSLYTRSFTGVLNTDTHRPQNGPALIGLALLQGPTALCVLVAVTPEHLSMTNQERVICNRFCNRFQRLVDF